MSPLPVDRRVEILEEHVNALSELPARVGAVETQLVAVRHDVTALRAELAVMGGDLRSEIRAGDEETRRQMRVLHEEVLSRIALLQEGVRGPVGRGPRSRRRRSSKRR